jgi:hypothetical protein
MENHLAYLKVDLKVSEKEIESAAELADKKEC